MTRILQACSHCSHEGRPCGASRARVAVAQGRPLQPGAPSPAGSEATAPSPVRTWRWPAAPGRPSEKRAGEGARGRDAGPRSLGAFRVSHFRGLSTADAAPGPPRAAAELGKPGPRARARARGRAGARPLGAEAGQRRPRSRPRLRDVSIWSLSAPRLRWPQEGRPAGEGFSKIALYSK